MFAGMTDECLLQLSAILERNGRVLISQPSKVLSNSAYAGRVQFVCAGKELCERQETG